MSADSGYRVPAEGAEAELREKGSRFLAIVEPVRDQDSVRARIKSFQQGYAGASHVCWAWRLGMPVAEGRSDAGEPAGTAGPPMLLVLRGADLSDVLAVVVRWFGGVKLGKGGLARAYAGVVRAAVDKLAVAERLRRAQLLISLPYERVGDLRRLLRPPQVEVTSESYGERVTMRLEVELACLEETEESLRAFAQVERMAGV